VLQSTELVPPRSRLARRKHENPLGFLHIGVNGLPADSCGAVGGLSAPQFITYFVQYRHNTTLQRITPCVFSPYLVANASSTT